MVDMLFNLMVTDTLQGQLVQNYKEKIMILKMHNIIKIHNQITVVEIKQLEEDDGT